jgi:ATP-dependent exoDNAse (exonuclease V) beta subunit
MVIFDPVKHTYQNPETQRYYTSVSSLLSQYKEPFDKDFHAQRKALMTGRSKEDVLNEWQATNKLACDKGQNVHSIIESFIKNNDVQDPKIISGLKQVFDKKEYKRILSEEIVYSDNDEIAGTSDLICDVDNDTFDVLDFKTNKKFLFFNKYNKYLKHPLNNLQQCQYNDYSLQLSLYAYLYGNLTNKKVRKICILYYDGDKFYSFHTPYLFWEISALLKHFNTNKTQHG